MHLATVAVGDGLVTTKRKRETAVCALRVALVSATAVAALAAAGSAAGASGLKVCGLVSAKQVAPLHVSPTCRAAAAYPGTLGMTYGANWTAAVPNGPVLLVTVTVITDSASLKFASKNLTQGLLGKPKKVRIGDAAYETHTSANGLVQFKINVLSGKDYATVELDGAKPSARATFETFTKALVAQLRRS